VHIKGSANRNVYSYDTFLQKIREISVNNFIIYFKPLQKQKQAKSKSSRWKEIIKIVAEINEM
jgi:hypothetical protein